MKKASIHNLKNFWLIHIKINKMHLKHIKCIGNRNIYANDIIE